jgi:hypothetical protein
VEANKKEILPTESDDAVPTRTNIPEKQDREDVIQAC